MYGVGEVKIGDSASEIIEYLDGLLVGENVGEVGENVGEVGEYVGEVGAYIGEGYVVQVTSSSEKTSDEEYLEGFDEIGEQFEIGEYPE